MRRIGLQLSPILVHVCLYDEAARSWATKMDEPGDAGMTVLRLALDSLAMHWSRGEGGSAKRRKGKGKVG